MSEKVTAAFIKSFSQAHLLIPAWQGASIYLLGTPRREEGGYFKPTLAFLVQDHSWAPKKKKSEYTIYSRCSQQHGICAYIMPSTRHVGYASVGTSSLWATPSISESLGVEEHQNRQDAWDLVAFPPPLGYQRNKVT